MSEGTVHIKPRFDGAENYSITIKRDELNGCGFWAKQCLTSQRQKECPAKKIVIISNQNVFGLYGDKVKNSLEVHGFEVFVWLMKDGEKYKDLRSLEDALKFLGENRLTRTDAVVALGGGVVGDLAGFAAAVYLRGIAYLQIPTTFLAMIDSSIGGKTAINSDFGKNSIGAFHHPKGVLIDAETLKTLATRDLTAGFYEAVKQHAIAGKKLFAQTAQFLKNYPPNEFEKHFFDEYFWPHLENFIASQLGFKAQIVMNDAREDSARSDSKSRKILNFGHTVGHALEKVTNYEYFKHGEAVAYGMLAAGEIAKNIGIFDKNELKSLNDVIGLVGELPKAENIEVKDIIEAVGFDKKSTGKSLQWILLQRIGKPVIVEGEKIPANILLKSLNKVLKKIDSF